MNAVIGGDQSGFKQVLGPIVYGKCSDNSNCLTNFRAINNLKIGSSLFQHQDIHKITWISNDHKNTLQIDHLAIIPICSTPCLQDIKVHHRDDSCSGHRPVTANVKIKLKRHKKSSQVFRHFNAGKFQKDPTMQLKFQIVLQIGLFLSAHQDP